jgi:hypothetical protein
MQAGPIEARPQRRPPAAAAAARRRRLLLYRTLRYAACWLRCCAAVVRDPLASALLLWFCGSTGTHVAAGSASARTACSCCWLRGGTY